MSSDETEQWREPLTTGYTAGHKRRHTGKATVHISSRSVQSYLQKTAVLGFEHNSLKVVNDCLQKRINLNSFYIITKYKNFIYRDCLQI